MYVALVAYVPFTFACFAFWGGRRAMLFSLLAGWLLLPWFNHYGRDVPLLHLKETFVPAIVLAASVLLDRSAWWTFRWRAFDLPVLVACVSPFLTSLSTDRGAYDGASSLLESFLTWGAPYLLGRVYLRSPSDLLDAARAVVISGLALLPLVVWEVRMSPQLHRQLYGFHQHSFAQHFRDGHYRPMVFMAHGLMVGMAMTAAALIAWWLWRSRSAERVFGLPLALAAPALAAGALLCRTTGASVLLLVGIAVLEATRLLRTPALVVVLALAPSAYCALRIGGLDTAPLVERAERWFGPERALSLDIRLRNERELVSHDMRRLWLGWGRWSDSRLMDEEGEDVSIVDSMWILQLGMSGLVVLVAIGMLLALPVLALARTVPAAAWLHPRIAPAAALAVTVGIWAVDDLFNAMMSPLYPMLAGAVLSFCARWSARSPRRARLPEVAPHLPVEA
jgi:hypothetical protein